MDLEALKDPKTLKYIAAGGVVIAAVLYWRSRNKGSASGTTILQPAPTGTPAIDTPMTTGPTPIDTGPTPVNNPIPVNNPVPDQLLTGPQLTNPNQAAIDLLHVADLQKLATQFPTYNSPGLASLFPGQGPNFPFSQSSQIDCQSGTTFVNAQIGCLENGAFGRMFGSGHGSQPLELGSGAGNTALTSSTLGH